MSHMHDAIAAVFCGGKYRRTKARKFAKVAVNAWRVHIYCLLNKLQK